MKIDFLTLSALCAADPALSEAIQKANFTVGALSNCSIVDKSFSGASTSILEFINQLALYENSLPCTQSPFRPDINAIVWPGSMNVGVNDIVVPIRYTAEPKNGLTPVGVATIDPSIQFGNNTVSSAIDVDVYALDFNGKVMDGYTRNTTLIPTGGANSSAQASIIACQRSVQGVYNSADEAISLDSLQSAGFYKVIELLPVAAKPGVIGNAIDFGVVVGASVSGFLRPYTLAVVFRQIGLVTADVTVNLGLANPTGNQETLRKLRSLIADGLVNS